MEQREIKFRCYTNTFNREGMFFPSEIRFVAGSIFADDVFISQSENDPNVSVLMQYTGLKDRNGKEIYPGDIFGVKALRCVVKKEESGEYKLNFLDKKIESISIVHPVVSGSVIIGNIYENPELLTN